MYIVLEDGGLVYCRKIANFMSAKSSSIRTAQTHPRVKTFNSDVLPLAPSPLFPLSAQNPWATIELVRTAEPACGSPSCFLHREQASSDVYVGRIGVENPGQIADGRRKSARARGGHSSHVVFEARGAERRVRIIGESAIERGVQAALDVVGRIGVAVECTLISKVPESEEVLEELRVSTTLRRIK
jgi:hypothetical protein